MLSRGGRPESNSVRPGAQDIRHNRGPHLKAASVKYTDWESEGPPALLLSPCGSMGKGVNRERICSYLPGTRLGNL